jgi:hypothetical protein
MIGKLKESFPKELGLPFDNSNMIGNENESDILITVICTNLGLIEQAKEVIEKMTLNTDYVYTEIKYLKRFLATCKRLNFHENNLIFERDSIKYNYRFLNDFLIITKDCLFSIYEDLFNFASVKYLYSENSHN